jgi:hypothetical protein
MKTRGIISVGPWIVTEKLANPIRLFESLALESVNIPLRIGVLDNNHEAVKAIRSVASFKEQKYSWRMVLGPTESPGKKEMVYAIGSAAKG